MKVYYSQIDVWLILLLIMMLLPMCLSLYMYKGWLPAVVLVLCLLLPVDIFTGTRYEVDDKSIYIKSGHLFKWHYDIKNITEIAKTNSLESSPALSMNRIRLVMKDKKYIIISPRNQKDFITHLLNTNPNIKIDERICL